MPGAVLGPSTAESTQPTLTGTTFGDRVVGGQ